MTESVRKSMSFSVAGSAATVEVKAYHLTVVPALWAGIVAVYDVPPPVAVSNEEDVQSLVVYRTRIYSSGHLLPLKLIVIATVSKDPTAVVPPETDEILIGAAEVFMKPNFSVSLLLSVLVTTDSR